MHSSILPDVAAFHVFVVRIKDVRVNDARIIFGACVVDNFGRYGTCGRCNVSPLVHV
jgi:hypothetical protein